MRFSLPKHEFVDYRIRQLGYYQSIRHHYKPFLLSDIGNVIREKIADDKRFQDLVSDDRWILFGSLNLQSYVMSVAEWYIYSCNEFGFEFTDQKLDEYFERDQNTAERILWVTGIELKDTLHITDSIKIVPIKDMPITDDKIFYDSYPQMDMPFYQFPKAAIVGSYTYPKTRKENEEVKYEGTSKFELLMVAYAISLIDDIVCAPYLMTNYLIGLPSLVTGGGGTYYKEFHFNDNISEIDGSQLKIIQICYNRLINIEANFRENMISSIRRLMLSKCASDAKDKILDMCIALEMLLLNDNNNSVQLSLSFRLRGALLLGESNKEREDVYATLKQIYSIRSKIAHSGILSNKAAEIERIHKNQNKYIILAAKIIKKILLDGFPDWNRLLLNR
ncbi:HEPN domain-containing protein [Lewinella sp. JB7]|uniref:HEPN domain-containing protein n=1 Tax=Lewinella sp. JB7 TaxID=2962887 RepID=UPI0020C98C37|nr:HEPN domain-containing protein [Lewinella sp. JB7]MCP9237974.1 HEPN domain-containing protein [Lewinella sp. JB7]